MAFPSFLNFVVRIHATFLKKHRGVTAKRMLGSSSFLSFRGRYFKPEMPLKVSNYFENQL